MRAIQVSDGVVTNIIRVKDDGTPPDGYTEAPAGVGMGYAVQPDGSYLPPTPAAEPPPTKKQRILRLEMLTTRRNLRAAILGDTTALQALQDIEDRIQAIRDEV